MEEAEQTIMRTSLSRPQQLLGGDRKLVILSGLGAALMAVSVMTFLSFLIAFLGFGSIARRLVELLRPFAMEIVALRRKPGSEAGVSIITEEQLPAALGAADHVVNILPASEATEGFFSVERLTAMAPGAVFYNIGRGTTVDQAALLMALRTGHLGAAWLDVTDPEPLPEDHPLRGEERCFITPHIAGGHADEAGTLVKHFLANFRLFLKGDALQDRVI